MPPQCPSFTPVIENKALHDFMQCLYFSLYPLAAFLILGNSTVSADLLYWVDHAPGHRIRAANMDGSNECTIHITLPDPYPQGLAINADDGTVYWTLYNSGRIYRANWGGSEPLEILRVDDTPVDCEIDWIHKKLYWGENTVVNGELTGCIRRAELNGTRVEEVVHDIAPLHIALDPFSNHVYWTDRQSGDVIMRAGFQSEPEILVNLRSRGLGLALDIAGNKMYWTEHINGVFRSDLNGDNVELLIDISQPKAIALDLRSTIMNRPSMFFGRFMGGGGAPFYYAIYRANLDGSEVEPLIQNQWGLPPGYVQDISIVPIAPDLAGDLNWDSQVNIRDLPLFAAALVDPNATDCDVKRADMDGNGVTDGRDIADFIECLFGGDCIVIVPVTNPTIAARPGPRRALAGRASQNSARSSP